MSNIILHNDKISVELNGENGSALSLTDAVGGESYRISTAFSISGSCNDCELRFASDGLKASLVSFGERSAVFEYSDAGFDIQLEYILPSDGAFIEYGLTIKRGGDWMLNSVVCENVQFRDKPDEIHFHDDQTIWHVPTNLFIRYPKSGIYAGLEYPYWDLSINGNEGFSLGYSPNYTVKNGEGFKTERAFLGVYRCEGVKRYSHGPFPGAKKLKYDDVLNFNDTGLPQDFPEPRVPEDVGIPPELLDWGEVWAMQEFFTKLLPVQPLPEDGYWVWQNGWWAGLRTPDPALLDPLEKSGVIDVLTAAMYLGHDSHPCSEPRYIRDVRIDPPGFPIYADEKSDEVVGYTEDFRAPSDYEAFINAAKARGMFIESFETPDNFYRSAPDWLSIDKDGNPHTFFDNRLSCSACDEYMDFHFEIFCRIMDKYKPRLWTLDGRWMSYLEYAGYGNGEIRPDPCYSDKHGHIPGDNRYKEWKNIEKFKKKIRRRYPNMCIEQYYGLKRGGVWSMANLNSDENIYETNGPDDNRFQTWHNENSRFRPVYLNYTSIMGKTPSEVEYSMLSSLSTSYYGQLAYAYAALRDYTEAREIFMRWREWGSAHHKYLLKRRCLFSYPGDKAVDGSAHLIDGQGYIFLFSPTGLFCDARIPLTSLSGFGEDNGGLYRFTIEAAVRSDGETAECAVPSCLRHGETLRLRISPKTALLIAVEKASEGVSSPLPDDAFGKEDVIEEAFD